MSCHQKSHQAVVFTLDARQRHALISLARRSKTTVRSVIMDTIVEHLAAFEHQHPSILRSPSRVIHVQKETQETTSEQTRLHVKVDIQLHRNLKAFAQNTKQQMSVVVSAWIVQRLNQEQQSLSVGGTK